MSNQRLDQYFHCVVQIEGDTRNFMLEMPFDDGFDTFQRLVLREGNPSGSKIYWKDRDDIAVPIENEQDPRGFKHIGNNKNFVG